jgi:S1-C subfamily serine protease
MAPEQALINLKVLGSGFLLVDSGDIVTASHVIQPWMDAIAEFQAGRSAAPDPAVAIFYGGTTQVNADSSQMTVGIAEIQHCVRHRLADVALVRTAQSMELPAVRGLRLAAEPCDEGDEVGVCGFPHGRNLHSDISHEALFTASFSQGIVSAVFPFAGAIQEVRTIFQVDAMINPGNSGGPIFDPRSGLVWGVVSATTNRTYTVTDTRPDGTVSQTAVEVPLGLARGIPVHYVRSLIPEMERVVAGQPGTQ